VAPQEWIAGVVTDMAVQGRRVSVLWVSNLPVHCAAQ